MNSAEILDQIFYKIDKSQSTFKSELFSSFTAFMNLKISVV